MLSRVVRRSGQILPAQPSRFFHPASSRKLSFTHQAAMSSQNKTIDLGQHRTIEANHSIKKAAYFLVEKFLPFLAAHNLPEQSAFISYSRENETLSTCIAEQKIHVTEIRLIAKLLRYAGINIWIDHVSGVAGAEFEKMLKDEINRVDFCVVMCTPDYRAKSLGNPNGPQFGVFYECLAMEEKLTKKLQEGNFDAWKEIIPINIVGKYEQSTPDFIQRNLEGGRLTACVMVDHEGGFLGWPHCFEGLLGILRNIYGLNMYMEDYQRLEADLLDLISNQSDLAYKYDIKVVQEKYYASIVSKFSSDEPINLNELRQILNTGVDVNMRHKVYGTTPLFELVRYGRPDAVEIAEILLQYNASLDSSAQGITLPMLIACNKHVPLLRWLLEQKAMANQNINLSGYLNQLDHWRGDGAIHKVAEARQEDYDAAIEIINLFHRYGADINAKTRHHQKIAFHIGAQCNARPIVERLNKLGADPLAKKDFERMPAELAPIDSDLRHDLLEKQHGASLPFLHRILLSKPDQKIRLAGEAQILKRLKKLLGKIEPATRNLLGLNETRNPHGAPLHIAIANHWHKILDFFLEQPDIQVNLKVGSMQEAPLYKAIRLLSDVSRHDTVRVKDSILLIVKTLLKAPGINVNIQNCYGVSPLYEAVYWGLYDVVKLLLESGANINDKSDSGFTPLIVAAWRNQYQIAELILRQGESTDVKAKTQMGESVLYIVAEYGAGFEDGGCDFATLLLDHGVDINEKNGHYQKTALHLAIEKNNVQLAVFLIERGASVAEKDSFGRTIQDYCTYHTDIMIKKAIITRGKDYVPPNADLDIKDTLADESSTSNRRMGR